MLDRNTMENRRILICSNELILGAAVEQLLAGEDDMEVYGIPTEDVSKIMKAIEQFQPDTVIFVDLLCMHELAAIYKMITIYPGMKLITVSSADTWLRIYQERKVLFNHPMDLSQIIRTP
jgi:hypothetical protein